MCLAKTWLKSMELWLLAEPITLMISLIWPLPEVSSLQEQMISLFKVLDSTILIGMMLPALVLALTASTVLLLTQELELTFSRTSLGIVLSRENVTISTLGELSTMIWMVLSLEWDLALGPLLTSLTITKLDATTIPNMALFSVTALSKLEELPSLV